MPWKLLLLDGHTSHRSDEFLFLAEKYHIILFEYPSHLTHVLQPLDVGIFQTFKWWHQQAIRRAMQNLDVDYNVASFLEDLTEIRTKTFRIGTVKSA